MPLFFFHYHTPNGSEMDDCGCRFRTLELAYLDAYRSMIDIGAALLKEQINPAAYRIDIADDDDRVLMELHFDEVFRRPQRMPVADVTPNGIQERLRAARRLHGQMEEACASARLSLERAHEVLRRARKTA